MLSRKTPRDFVLVDEFWAADEYWPKYYIGNKVWVFVDEYRAELPGDEDYSRIIIHAEHDQGWLFSRPLNQKKKVLAALARIKIPVSEAQLEAIGFCRWTGSYI